MTLVVTSVKRNLSNRLYRYCRGPQVSGMASDGPGGEGSSSADGLLGDQGLEGAKDSVRLCGDHGQPSSRLAAFPMSPFQSDAISSWSSSGRSCGCGGGGDFNLPILLAALAAAVLFLQQVITMAVGRKRRRKRADDVGSALDHWIGETAVDQGKDWWGLTQFVLHGIS